MIDIQVLLVEAKLDKLKIASLLGEKRECGGGGGDGGHCVASSGRIFYWVTDKELLLRKPCKNHLAFYKERWLECKEGMRTDE